MHAAGKGADGCLLRAGLFFASAVGQGMSAAAKVGTACVPPFARGLGTCSLSHGRASVSSSTRGGLVDYFLLPRAALVPLSWAGASTDRGAGSSSLPPIRVLLAPVRHPTLGSYSSGTFLLENFRKAPEKPSFWKLFGNLTPRTWPLALYHSPFQTLTPRPPSPTHSSPRPHDPSPLIPHPLPLPALPVGPSDFTIGRYLAVPSGPNVDEPIPHWRRLFLAEGHVRAYISL